MSPVTKHAPSLPALPVAPEESWRRFDPSTFFLPAEEVLRMDGSPWSAAGASDLLPWKVYLRESAPAELQSMLRSQVLPLAGFAPETLTSQPELGEALDALDVAAVAQLRAGRADVLQAAGAQLTLTAASVRAPCAALTQDSAIAGALAERLESLSPSELVFTLSAAPAMGSEAPLVVLSLHLDPDLNQSLARVRIEVSAGSRLRLLVLEGSSHFSHHRLQLNLAVGARVDLLHLYRGEQEEGRVLSERAVTLAEGARLCAAEVISPHGQTRVNSIATIAGAKAEAKLGVAAVLAQGFFDHEPVQRHVAPGGASSLKHKMLLSGRARGNFQGLVTVTPEAPQSVASQVNKNLLLGKRARVDASPRLEVLPADVSCKHGSATGEIDPKQVYYLETRGFAEGDARQMIVGGFVADALSALEEAPALKALAEAALSGALRL